MKRFATAFALAMLIFSRAPAQAPILKSLPSDVQQRIEGIRELCPSTERVTKGDEGLQFFTVSGAQAVLVDELDFCGGGCMHGINCATGYTHDVAIYIRQGGTWRKLFSVAATEPIFLSIEPDSENPRFRALVLSVHAGWDWGCPVRNKDDPTAWKHEKCDFLVKWDGSRFVHKPL